MYKYILYVISPQQADICAITTPKLSGSAFYTLLLCDVKTAGLRPQC